MPDRSCYDAPLIGTDKEPRMLIYPWREIEITLTAENDYPSPYTNVDVWAEFTLDAGITLRRPAFWDGGRTWKIRFASPVATGRWAWRSFSSVADAGLAGQSGELVCDGRAAHRSSLRAARLLAHVAGRTQPGACRWHARAAGGRYRLGAALARHRAAVPHLCRRPAGQRLQRCAADERAARHARARPARPHRRRRLRCGLRGSRGRAYQPAEPGLLPVSRSADRHPGGA